MQELTLGGSVDSPRLLFLGARSDDIEIGCGGTAYQLLQVHPDAAVRWVVFGATGQREDEARQSSECYLESISDSAIQIESFPNSYFPDHWSDIKAVFEEQLKAFAPTVIFTHYRNDRHQDHRVISDLTWNTFRNHFILEYEIPKFDGDLGRPNFYVPLAEKTVDWKLHRLIEKFQSQTSRHWFDEEAFRSILRLRGVESAEMYAEAFYGRKTIWNTG